ncbi:MAG TPA: DUF535 family protein [Rhizomicrobium sp.]|nr:DUF535 family protein [Rhizomicrobium sp.]
MSSAQPLLGGGAGILQRAREIARRYSVRDALRFTRAASIDQHYRSGWLAFLEALTAAHALPPAGVDLLMKPLNPYLLLNLPVGERIRMLRNHYTMMVESASPRAVAHIWRGDAFDASVLTGKTGSYMLLLGGTRAFLTRKEGETTLALRDEETHEVLAKVTFLLTQAPEGGRGVLIGGLQGSRSDAAKQTIIRATRDLHGLRPRDAVLLGVFAIADQIGARQAWAVSSAMHVHRARDKRQQERLFADYDSVWLERGARGALPFGWTFDVPVSPAPTGRNLQGQRRDALKEIVWRTARTAFAGTPDAAAVRCLAGAATG